MNSCLSDFPWPVIEGTVSPPVWNGSAFEANEHSWRILPLGKSESNWSGELSEMHVREAGSQHPIDIASRTLAIRTLKQWCLSESPLVLEIGSSSGYMLSAIRRELPHVQLIGSDYLSPAMAVAATANPDVPLVEFDLRTSPLPSNSFDGIVILNVLEHIDDDNAAISHMARMLKPGGIAHIEVPAFPSCYDAYDEYLLHYRRYKLEELLNLLAKHDLKFLSSTHLGFCVFPAFWAIKQWRRRQRFLTPEDKKRIVEGQIRETKASMLMDFAMRAELLLGRIVSFPFGIRCVVIAQKQ